MDQVVFISSLAIVAIVAIFWRITRVIPQPNQPVGNQYDLIVSVKNEGDRVSCDVYGTNMQHVAYAAAFLTQLAARNCQDGFEKGLEHIQADAMNIANGSE